MKHSKQNLKTLKPFIYRGFHVFNIFTLPFPYLEFAPFLASSPTFARETLKKPLFCPVSMAQRTRATIAPRYIWPFIPVYIRTCEKGHLRPF